MLTIPDKYFQYEYDSGVFRYLSPWHVIGRYTDDPWLRFLKWLSPEPPRKRTGIFAVFETNQIFGGDSAMIYIGSYVFDQNNLLCGKFMFQNM